MGLVWLGMFRLGWYSWVRPGLVRSFFDIIVNCFDFNEQQNKTNTCPISICILLGLRSVLG